MGDVEGIAAGPITAWFGEHLPGVEPPLTFSLISGGHSNLTYRVTDEAGSSWVLRRPPLGHLLPTAHDMGREFRIISALGPTAVPVARALGYCDDESVNERPFYVMDYVDGHILRTSAEAEKLLDAPGRRAAAESLADVLADIHAVDPDAVGLGELGRKDGYIERQLRRWYGQFEKSKTREVPAVDDVHARLSAAIPPQGPASIVHGDYRLDNTMLGDDGRVIAVLDWEICTLGDPMADLGLLAVYWTDPGDEMVALATSPTSADGFLRRDEVMERYAARSGRDMSRLGFYIAFGYWKLACILEGVYARYVGGNMGSDASGFEVFGQNVVALAEQAREALEATI